MQDSSSPTTETTKNWQTLTRYQRRVAGVLVEKAKTTPDAYPLSLNALTNGCNQKSNRAPQMNLTAEMVQDVADELRDLGAILEVQGGSRVAKYRHAMYEWLGVDKTELAVMAELLLRGEQTVGELRARAARMDDKHAPKLSDMAALKSVLAGLIEKDLVISLTPEGRGQIVTHNLYEPDEHERLRQRVADHGGATANPTESPVRPSTDSGSNVSALEAKITELEATIATLVTRIEKLESGDGHPGDRIS